MENTTEPQQDATPPPPIDREAEGNTETTAPAATPGPLKPAFLSKNLMKKMIAACTNAMDYAFDIFRAQRACDNYNESHKDGGEDPIERPKDASAEEVVARARTYAIDVLHSEPCVSILYLAISMYRNHKRRKNQTEEQLQHYDEVYRRCKDGTPTTHDFLVWHRCVHKAKKEGWIKHELLKHVIVLLGFIASSSLERLKEIGKAIDDAKAQADEKELKFLKDAVQLIESSIAQNNNDDDASDAQESTKEVKKEALPVPCN